MIICDVCKVQCRAVIVPAITNGIRDNEGNIPEANAKVAHSKVIDCCQRCQGILLAKFKTALAEALRSAQAAQSEHDAARNAIGDDAIGINALNAALDADRN